MSRLLHSTLAVLLVATLTAVAVAKYNPDHDVYIQVESEVLEQIARALELGAAGSELFDTQEGAHATFTETSGQEIEHYYIWFCAGDQCVPVDPFRFSN